MSITTHVNCADCGIEFCIPKELEVERRESHDTFYCPNGHKLHFPHETEKERQIRELTAKVELLQRFVTARDVQVANLQRELRSERARMAARVRWARWDKEKKELVA